MYYIYILQNKINNKIYVGQTNNLSTRKSHHKSSAYNIKYKDYNGYLYRSIRKYGWANFIFTMIEEHETLKEVNDAEEFWIGYFRSRNKQIGYNIQFGGNNTAKTDQHKLNISLSQMGEKSHHAILKEWQVIEILDKYVHGDCYLDDLSKEYKVNKTTISDIINKRTWIYLSKNYPIIKKRSPSKNKNNNSKLNEENVINIIKMYNTNNYKYVDIALLFNVYPYTIAAIINGKTWKNISKKYFIIKSTHQKSGKNKLTEDQVVQVIKMYKTGNYSYEKIGKLFNVNRCTIRRIVYGKIWKHINRN